MRAAKLGQDEVLVTAERYTPAKDFLHEHWADVWDEFQASGVTEELLELVMLEE